MATTMRPVATSIISCVHCSSQVDAGSKFCGNCGAPAKLQSRFGPGAFDPTISARAIQASNALNQKASQYARSQSAPVAATPSFAKNKRRARAIPPEMRAEMATLMATELRERIFLFGHYMVFLITNLVGLAIAVKCYVEFSGDELSKMMMASTPLMFINLCALCALVPIKGTKKEIARVKERMTYLKLAMEFDNII